MKYIITTIIVASLCTACVAASESELARVASPDGHAVAIVSQKVQRGMWMPGPEPPRVKAQFVRLCVTVDGKMTYDSGLEDVGVYQPCQFAYDIAWAPDSSHVAFRAISTLRVVGKDGKSKSFEVPKDNSLVSSFKWTSNRELLVVAKKVNTPLDMHGYPVHYHGYLAKAQTVRVFRVDLESGVTERFALDTKDSTSPDPYLSDSKEPTFMFHSVAFLNQEISPKTPRVAFSDGSAICVYDDSIGKVIASAPMTGSIEGTWWDTNDRLIVGIGLLSGEKHFSTFEISTEAVREQSSVYLPLWTGAWNNADWFRTGKK